jgi:pyruvate ferredoxin oxidoreductase alpha subunit
MDGPIATVVAGLGGRPITRESLRRMMVDATLGALDPLTFLDLDRGLVDRELGRMEAARRSGPSAENLLRDLARPSTATGGAS